MYVKVQLKCGGHPGKEPGSIGYCRWALAIEEADGRLRDLTPEERKIEQKLRQAREVLTEEQVALRLRFEEGTLNAAAYQEEIDRIAIEMAKCYRRGIEENLSEGCRLTWAIKIINNDNKVEFHRLNSCSVE